MKNLIIAIASIFVVSCANNSTNEFSSSEGESYNAESKTEASAPMYYVDETYAEEYEKSSEDILPANQNQSNASEKIPFQQKLIKKGNIGFKTDDVHATRGKVNQLIKHHNAYIANETEDYYSSRINQYITIKIPNANFEKFVDELCDGIDKFDTKSIKVIDVTDEFVDTETRIENKKALEQKYITLLEKAKTIKEILEIENEINYLRLDIESAEAHLKSLSSQVAFSTLELYIYEETSEVTHKEEPENRFIKGFKGGWNAIVNFFVALTYAWPLLTIILIGLIILKITLKKRKNKA